LSGDLPAETAGVHESVEPPEVKPVVVHHRRMAVRCPGCGVRVAAPPPAGGTPFGPRLHAVATYLKTYQALSYERLQAALSDLFGLAVSQSGIMNLLRRAQGRFEGGRESAVAALRRADVVASDETGVRIEGANAYHWVFRCKEAVVHHDADPTRSASVVREMMDGHRPAVWLSDRYSAQQGHAAAQQTCLAHLSRDVAYAVEASDDPVPFRLKLWLGSAFDLADRVTDLAAAATLAAKRRALERRLSDILAAPTSCELARGLQERGLQERGLQERGLQDKLRRARDQLLTFADRPGEVEATNNGCERHLRPCVVQRKVTNGYRAKWAAEGEADIRTVVDTTVVDTTVVDTARLKPGTGIFGTILQTASA
jgi:transposase